MNFKNLIFNPFFSGKYSDESEYYNLSEEEKMNVDYFNECLNDPDEKFNNACFLIMLLTLELVSKMDSDEDLAKEEVEKKKTEILDGFNDNDKQRLETFMYTCIQNMGIYSEERVMERKLKMKGNDK